MAVQSCGRGKLRKKTKLVRFTRPKRDSRPGGDDSNGSGTFNLLGFTHYWGRSLKGNWVVKRKTQQSRLSRARRNIAMWCRANLHLPIKAQHEMLVLKLRGHDAYYGITGNVRALEQLREWVRCDWLCWLRRRSHAAYRNWEWMLRLLEVFPLPPARVVHSVMPRAANP